MSDSKSVKSDKVDSKKDKATEKVLVIDSKFLTDYEPWTPAGPKLDKFLHYSSYNAFFALRGECEENENFKQIIPYCAIYSEPGYFSYTRQVMNESESRLKTFRSLGVGGHINPKDALFDKPLYHNRAQEIILNCAHREINEECCDGDSRTYGYRILGLINDNSTQVGRVHVGVAIVFTAKSSHRDVTGLPSAKSNYPYGKGKFLTQREISAKTDWEPWSEIFRKSLDFPLTKWYDSKSDVYSD